MHVLLYVSSLKQQQPPNFSEKKLPRRHCVGSRLSTRSVMLKCSQLLPKIGISPWWPDCAHWTHISVWLILYISSPVACQLVAPKKSPNHLTTSENVGRQPQHAPSTSRLLILVQSIITNHPIHSNFPSLHTPSPSDICKQYNCNAHIGIVQSVVTDSPPNIATITSSPLKYSLKQTIWIHYSPLSVLSDVITHIRE